MRIKKIKKYAASFFVVILITTFFNFILLRKDSSLIIEHIKNSNFNWIILIFLSIIGFFILDALITKKFINSYLQKYSFFKALPVSFIGMFFSSITPTFSGINQIAKALTLSEQGVSLSCGASLMIINIILVEIVTLFFGIITIFFKPNLLSDINGISIGKIKLSLYPYSLLAFFLNLIIILIICFMSISYKAQNFFISLLVKFLKFFNFTNDPEKIKNNLNIQIERFRLEFKRSIKNFNLTLILSILVFLKLICRYSIPWMIGAALNGYGPTTTGSLSFDGLINSCLISNYHYLSTNLIPIPGSAGVSELLFLKLFGKFYINDYICKTAQLIWRFFSYYFVLLFSAIITFSYKSSPIEKDEFYNYNYKIFATIQFEDYEEKKKKFLKNIIKKENFEQEKMYIDIFINNKKEENLIENNKKYKWHTIIIE